MILMLMLKEQILLSIEEQEHMGQRYFQKISLPSATAAASAGAESHVTASEPCGPAVWDEV